MALDEDVQGPATATANEVAKKRKRKRKEASPEEQGQEEEKEVDPIIEIGASTTLVAPPPGPPPKPVGAIMWPGGYMAGAEAAVVAKEPRMKAKGPPSKTRQTTAVERYSSAYSTVGHFPNGHLQDWLHAIAPKFFTVIMVGRLDRNQLLSYLYLLTGLLPSDRPPS